MSCAGCVVWAQLGKAAKAQWCVAGADHIPSKIGGSLDLDAFPSMGNVVFDYFTKSNFLGQLAALLPEHFGDDWPEDDESEEIPSPHPIDPSTEEPFLSRTLLFNSVDTSHASTRAQEPPVPTGLMDSLRVAPRAPQDGLTDAGDGSRLATWRKVLLSLPVLVACVAVLAKLSPTLLSMSLGAVSLFLAYKSLSLTHQVQRLQEEQQRQAEQVNSQVVEVEGHVLEKLHDECMHHLGMLMEMDCGDNADMTETQLAALAFCATIPPPLRATLYRQHELAIRTAEMVSRHITLSMPFQVFMPSSSSLRLCLISVLRADSVSLLHFIVRR